MMSGVRHIVTQGVCPVGEGDRFCEGRSKAIEWVTEAGTNGVECNHPSCTYRIEQYVGLATEIIIPFRADSPIRDVIVIKVFAEDDCTKQVTSRSHEGGSQHQRVKVTNS